jgi:hypothetical protein
MGARGFAGGTLALPAGWTTADIVAEVAAFKDGTYQLLQLDGTNGYVDGTRYTVVDDAAASTTYVIPREWFGALWVKPRSIADYTTGPTNTNQTAQVLVTLIS